MAAVLGLLSFLVSTVCPECTLQVCVGYRNICGIIYCGHENLLTVVNEI
jgi:hypothetical protein